jgi:hypothetical protein
MSIEVGSLNSKPTKKYFTANNSSQANGGQVMGILTTIPSWPEGATGFSIDSADSVIKSTYDVSTASSSLTNMTSSDLNIQSTGLGGKAVSQTAANTALRKNFGAVLVEEVLYYVGYSDFVSVAAWKGADDTSDSKARGQAGGLQHTRIPTAVGLDNSVNEYIHDFGLAQCNNAGCTSVSRVDKVHKTNNNDLTFYVEVIRPDTNWDGASSSNNDTKDIPDTPFVIQFSGVWHY